MVVGLRFAAAFRAAGVFAVDWDFATALFFFFAAGFFAVVVAAPLPDVTREECFARGRTGFLGGAASAIEPSVKAATSATRNIVIDLRAIESSSALK